ncbi:hypothetical protein MNV49_005068 [Pseudohyphozyma bogoriensis]|nr:hypothetical protein MNV49_005061 [Pseudohyphozyma bogoriensis]KAI5478539.1 hypothetical protein MNV49_005068 [Pseudohyphozyma bogoriensis]
MKVVSVPLTLLLVVGSLAKHAPSVRSLRSPSSSSSNNNSNPINRSTLPLVFHVDPSRPDEPAPLSAAIGDAFDTPDFGARCEFVKPYVTCGDYFEPRTGLDHALFCSPDGVCAGKGAACGSSEACAEGLSCNLQNHRCAPTGSFTISVNAQRLDQRRKASKQLCPAETEACHAPNGAFHCVFTMRETEECGGCLDAGGIDCSALPNVMSSSCRDGSSTHSTRLPIPDFSTKVEVQVEEEGKGKEKAVSSGLSFWEMHELVLLEREVWREESRISLLCGKRKLIGRVEGMCGECRYEVVLLSDGILAIPLDDDEKEGDSNARVYSLDEIERRGARSRPFLPQSP